MLLELRQTYGVQVPVLGELHEPISVVIQDTSLDQLVRRLGQAGGYLVSQQAGQYVFFGRNVDEVTLAIPLKRLTADEAGQSLAQFEDVEIVALPDVKVLVVRALG